MDLRQPPESAAASSGVVAVPIVTMLFARTPLKFPVGGIPTMKLMPVRSRPATASLIFKSDRRIRLVRWKRRSQAARWPASGARLLMRRFHLMFGRLVFHRYPQVHCRKV